MLRPLIPVTLLAIASLPRMEASEGPPPPITRETLVGTWEAAGSWGAGCVYRLQVNASGPSYLAFNLFGTNTVWRSTSVSAHNGKLRLHFHCISGRWTSGMTPEMDELDISGKGTSTEVRGSFEAVLKMKPSPYDPVESNSLSFSKPVWVEFAAKQTKGFEALIKDAKARQQ